MAKKRVVDDTEVERSSGNVFADLGLPYKEGDTVDFLLTTKRDRKAALRFLRKAIESVNAEHNANNSDRSRISAILSSKTTGRSNA